MSELTKVTHGPFVGEGQESNIILCDCNGTLFGGEGFEGNNEKLIGFLRAAKQLGYEVVIFSDEPNGAQLMVKTIGIRYFKDQDFFGEVNSKSEFEGKKAFIVIDDDHSTHKVDVADNHKFSPMDPRIDKMMSCFEGVNRLPNRQPPLN